MFRPGLVLAGCVLATASGGCGSPPERTVVTGRVTYNGTALDKPGGMIVFVGPDGSQVSAPVGPDGAYRADGVTVGPNRVIVYYPNPAATKQTPSRTPRAGQVASDPPPKIPPFLTPTAYAMTDTSGLAVTVEKDTVYNPELTGPPIK